MISKEELHQGNIKMTQILNKANDPESNFDYNGNPSKSEDLNHFNTLNLDLQSRITEESYKDSFDSQSNKGILDESFNSQQLLKPKLRNKKVERQIVKQEEKIKYGRKSSQRRRNLMRNLSKEKQRKLKDALNKEVLKIASKLQPDNKLKGHLKVKYI